MTADAKRDVIKKVYGSEVIRGELISKMPDKQIHAIYGSLSRSGRLEMYENYKERYVMMFPNTHYMAKRRANKMSLFELQRVVDGMEKILEEDSEGKKIFPDRPCGYQYTLNDWLDELLGKEQKNGNSNEASGEKQEDKAQ